MLLFLLHLFHFNCSNTPLQLNFPILLQVPGGINLCQFNNQHGFYLTMVTSENKNNLVSIICDKKIPNVVVGGYNGIRKILVLTAEGDFVEYVPYYGLVSYALCNSKD